MYFPISSHITDNPSRIPKWDVAFDILRNSAQNALEPNQEVLGSCPDPFPPLFKKNKKRKERKEEGDRKEGREKGKEGRKEGGNYSSCGKECKDHVDPIRVEINILVSL